MANSIITFALILTCLQGLAWCYDGPKFMKLTRKPLRSPLNFSEAELEKMKQQFKPRLDKKINGKRSQDPSAGIPGPGMLNSHIVGGAKTPRGLFPWQAAIEIDSQTFCGGSLLNEIWVLTAAHCTDRAKKFTVMFGAKNVDRREKGRLTMVTKRKKVHSGWSFDTLQNDISLLRMPRRVKFTNIIKPIRLPSTAMADLLFEGYNTTISGWGRVRNNVRKMSSVLYHVNMRVVPITQCAKVYGPSNYATALCLMGKKGKGTCEGDSGGPLITKEEDGIFTQIGIVSYGASEGCAKDYPDVFTRVPSYLGWISEHTGLAPRKPNPSDSITADPAEEVDTTDPADAMETDAMATDSPPDYKA